MKSKDIQSVSSKKRAYRYSLGEKKLREEMLYHIMDSQQRILGSKFFRFAGSKPTVGGAVIEEFSVVGTKSSMHCLVGICTKGASPVTVVSQKCGLDKITVEFSADPSNDHEITYMVAK